MDLQQDQPELASISTNSPSTYGSVKDAKSSESAKAAVTEALVPDKAPSQLGIPAVCWYILVVELCERLSFYTFAGSQEFFLEHIGFPLSAASALNATMWTLCTVLAVLASWFADVVFGRYRTILVSGLLYAVGASLAAAAAWPGLESKGLYFLGMLGFMPIATAGIKANISNFGADQYDPSHPGAAAAQEKFFSVFYCSINVGAGLAYGFFTTFAASGGLGVPKSYGYFTAYALMAVCMVVAVGICWAGRRGYRVHPLLRRSALASTAECLVGCAANGSHKAAVVCLGVLLLCSSILLSATESLVPSMGMPMLVAAFCCAGLGIAAVTIVCVTSSWLATGADGTPTAEEQDTQKFIKLLPTLFMGSLSFGALYNSMQFWYQQQACQMDVRLGSMQLSGSFFNIADCFAIVLMTPIILGYINPLMEKRMGKLGHGFKFGIGMAVAVISVLVAARLEQLRKAAAVLPVQSNCAPPGVNMSDLQGAWMMVPYFLMGVAEIYTQPTLLHFAYSKSPPSMRTFAMAASFFIQAVSSAIFALLVKALSSYIPNDLNNGHLEFGYYVNIAIGITLFVPFLIVLKMHEDAEGAQASSSA